MGAREPPAAPDSSRRTKDRHADCFAGIETTAHTRPARRTAPIDAQVADRLLDLLSTDDAFRRLFTREPAKALAQVGFVKAEGETSPDFCFWGIRQLASKAQIAQARDEIRRMLTAGLSRTTPRLEMDVAGARTRK